MDSKTAVGSDIPANSIESLAKSNAIGILFATPAGAIVDANDEFLRIVGYSRQDLEAGVLNWMDLTPPEWREANQQAARQLDATGSAPAFEKEYLRKDGSRVPVMVGIAALPQPSATNIVFVVDLSERKRARQERDRLMGERIAMLDSVGDGIYGLDRAGRCTFINRAAVEMLGYRPEECIGRNMHDLVHTKRPDGSPYPGEGCPILNVVRKGDGIHNDNEVLWRHDGTSFAAECCSYPIIENGQIEGNVVSFKDISERRQAQEQLRESEERFHSAFAYAASGMFILDLAGRFLDVNLAFCNMTGYSGEELLGLQIATLLHPADSERIQRQIKRLLQRAIPTFVTTARYLRNDGRVQWARGSASLLCDAAGKALQIVSVTEDITERLRAETDLRHSEERYRSIVENTHEGICMCDADRRVTYCNPGLISMLGHDKDVQLQCSDFHFEEDAQVYSRRFEQRKRGVSESYEARLRHSDGSAIWANTSASPLTDDDANFAGALCMFSNVTERKRLEEQLQQSQKMEAVGRLAGGIAHDFNNLLTVILGYGSVLERKLMPEDPLNSNVIEIRKAGERGAALTQKLLAFSRKQVQCPRVLSLNHLIRDTEGMLRRLIGEDIRLGTALDPAAGNIQADPGQMEQVLMNLVINARDAMSSAGRLSIQTNRQDLDPGAAELLAVPPGAYVVLTVTDTGCGMDEPTKAKIFEPFFTTKAPGIGTGLWLSTVLGIVKQSGGSICVQSELNVGTSFEIYLPLVQEAATAPQPKLPLPAAADHETILLVEDDSSIRRLAGAVLREHGYRVVEASSAEEALAAGPILASVDLLLTDVVMSGMNGQELADALLARYPAVKVLLTSGYTENARLHHSVAGRGLNFLAKPFRPEELLAKAAEVLVQKRVLAKILVADDDAQVRSFLATLLEVEGYSVIQASNGKEAQARCRETNIDLMITDLVMPEQEGLETIHAIRKNWPEIRLIAISGAFGGAFLELAKKLGADAMLRKPFEPEAILSEVRNLLKG
jgi:two-component system cell cycle sensor histidine kinase/response regulator CckA